MTMYGSLLNSKEPHLNKDGTPRRSPLQCTAIYHTSNSRGEGAGISLRAGSESPFYQQNFTQLPLHESWVEARNPTYEASDRTHKPKDDTLFQLGRKEDTPIQRMEMDEDTSLESTADKYARKRKRKKEEEEIKEVIEVKGRAGTRGHDRKMEKKQKFQAEGRLTPTRPAVPNYSKGYTHRTGGHLSGEVNLWSARGLTEVIRPGWDTEVREQVILNAGQTTGKNGVVLRETTMENGTTKFLPSRGDQKKAGMDQHYEVGHMPGWAERVEVLTPHRYFIREGNTIYQVKARKLEDVMLIANDPRHLRLEEGAYNVSEGKDQKQHVERLKEGLQTWDGDAICAVAEATESDLDEDASQGALSDEDEWLANIEEARDEHFAPSDA